MCAPTVRSEIRPSATQAIGYVAPRVGVCCWGGGGLQRRVFPPSHGVAVCAAVVHHYHVAPGRARTGRAQSRRRSPNGWKGHWLWLCADAQPSFRNIFLA